ncbi:tetratricopeptide repeat protein [Rhodoplanes sp. Z2-YC6860]|uniref:tetratricopeptide repeat protein n=1 Tax=Rhodoplanes sp. Z2-YC6860 TaxID=674703 RepID=UPI00078CA752|nr:tetratricopeptide repeat protein [Rhodoplanes sp. Z2-YC6860]AMN40959.1 tetratricopeptide repeat protein [Rhodoplanes sp. Z2-YC6860]
MNVSKKFRHLAGVVLGAAALCLPATLSAQGTSQNPPLGQTFTPSASELARLTMSGSYLAARHAGTQRDAGAAAAYYRAALRNDPKNTELLQLAFLSVLSEGDVEEATRLAEQVIVIDKNDRIARLVIGVKALKQKKYQAAKQNLTQSVRGPITDLAATLLAAWASYGANDAKGAVEAIDKLQGAEWYALFKDLHAGLILDLSGGKKEAGKRFDRAAKLDGSALRIVEAYGSWLSRNGNKEEALKVYKAFDAQLPRHPLITEEMDLLNKGKTVPPIVDSPQTGAAEVLYGLGAAIGRRGGENLGLVYLQLALYLAPNQPLALLSLADLYEQVKNPELAIKMYERVPQNSPLRRNAEIQLATDLDSLDRTDEAKQRLGKLIAEHGDDTDAIMALGNILRSRKAFDECADVYGKAIAQIANPERSNWLVYYFRGICNERAKKWDRAEADLKKALELFPDQPHVLNYLGYSWIDQGTNLDEGMRMIRRAVEQRPDDGYIVDSLGWAYYRVGNYDEAVKNLERAVELKPEDPTINDHLGDAYWKVGRTLEANFQWSHARDLKPEPEDLVKIKQKIASGMPEETSVANGKKKADGEATQPN